MLFVIFQQLYPLIIQQTLSLTRDWSKRVMCLNTLQLKLVEYPSDIPQFQNCTCCEKCLKDNKHNSLHQRENMLEYLSKGIICSSKLAVLFATRNR